ncbi:hypothetical protein AVEN_172969-1 [Araneus ventricosus]|uniref:Uncharacterized protein n=1 Tax=Araneus ventricosus TaxID=182803 RepID=A0A4Y2FV12_ARAVE|nr:hypothetical protein AVEN_172969-1 [Araneus ventricosus]
MPGQCERTLRDIVKYRARTTTTALNSVREVKPFEVGRERTMFREEDHILSNPVSAVISFLWSKGPQTARYSLATINRLGFEVLAHLPFSPYVTSSTSLHFSKIHDVDVAFLCKQKVQDALKVVQCSRQTKVHLLPGNAQACGPLYKMYRKDRGLCREMTPFFNADFVYLLFKKKVWILEFLKYTLRRCRSPTKQKVQDAVNG